MKMIQKTNSHKIWRSKTKILNNASLIPKVQKIDIMRIYKMVSLKKPKKIPIK